jgi:hypothetical protein
MEQITSLGHLFGVPLRAAGHPGVRVDDPPVKRDPVAVDGREQVVLDLERPNRRPEKEEAGGRHRDEPSHQTPRSLEPPCRVKWGERTNAVGRTRVCQKGLAVCPPASQTDTPLLDGPDPLPRVQSEVAIGDRVQSEVAIGDHAGCLLQCQLGLGDEVLQSSYPSGASLSWASSKSCFVN